jgi:hypothetical protein
VKFSNVTACVLFNRKNKNKYQNLLLPLYSCCRSTRAQKLLKNSFASLGYRAAELPGLFRAGADDSALSLPHFL